MSHLLSPANPGAPAAGTKTCAPNGVPCVIVASRSGPVARVEEDDDADGSWKVGARECGAERDANAPSLPRAEGGGPSADVSSSSGAIPKIDDAAGGVDGRDQVLDTTVSVEEDDDDVVPPYTENAAVSAPLLGKNVYAEA